MAKFSVVLSSSLYGDLRRRSAPTRAGAYAIAVGMLNERAADEACLAAATPHNEVLTLRVERDDGGTPS